MNKTTLFIIGLSIFAIYMFFLLRMIWNQNRMQTKDKEIAEESN